MPQPINKPDVETSPKKSLINKSQSNSSEANHNNSAKKITDDKSIDKLITLEQKNNNHETIAPIDSVLRNIKNNSTDKNSSKDNTTSSTNHTKNITIPNPITENKSISESIGKEQTQNSFKMSTIPNTNNTSILSNPPKDSTISNINTRPIEVNSTNKPIVEPIVG